MSRQSLHGSRYRGSSMARNADASFPKRRGSLFLSSVLGPTGNPPPSLPPARGEFPIDLSTALRLAEVENPLIAEARQRIGEALARQQGARALLLPSLNAGTNYHFHTGNLQRSSGRILNL